MVIPPSSRLKRKLDIVCLSHRTCVTHVNMWFRLLLTTVCCHKNNDSSDSFNSLCVLSIVDRVVRSPFTYSTEFSPKQPEKTKNLYFIVNLEFPAIQFKYGQILIVWLQFMCVCVLPCARNSDEPIARHWRISYEHKFKHGFDHLHFGKNVNELASLLLKSSR